MKEIRIGYNQQTEMFEIKLPDGRILAYKYLTSCAYTMEKELKQNGSSNTVHA